MVSSFIVTIDNNDNNVGGVVIVGSRFTTLLWIERQLMQEWRMYVWDGDCDDDVIHIVK